jgi:DNA invertase Pin-like site-specific DNA recombinase
MTAMKVTRPRACAYVRVSTEDQVEHGISIPNQIRKIEEFCRAKEWELVEVFEELGQSGKDTGRPQFNTMLGRATSVARPFDVVVVYALSRFARSLEIQITAFGQLRAAGVELASVSEPLDKGPNGNLMRSMVGAFNQHTSDQCAMNTIRAMNANAAEGFWNGGPVPFGYRSVTVEKRKDKDKEKLAIHDEEAEVVRCVFRLAQYGDGNGPMGARAIAEWLNARGYMLRGGRYHYYNCSARVNRSAEACDLKSIRREDLDQVVLGELACRIFDRNRLVELLRHLLDRSQEVIKRRRKDLALAKAELTTVTKAVTNLLLAIESGAMRPDEPQFVERMAHNRARKSALEADVRSLERQLSTSKIKISEEMIAAFADRMANALREGEPQFRAAYVRLFVSRVELSAEEIRIFGSKSALERALIHDGEPVQGEVPIFDREWCRLQDSNL